MRQLDAQNQQCEGGQSKMAKALSEEVTGVLLFK